MQPNGQAEVPIVVKAGGQEIGSATQINISIDDTSVASLVGSGGVTDDPTNTSATLRTADPWTVGNYSVAEFGGNTYIRFSVSYDTRFTSGVDLPSGDAVIGYLRIAGGPAEDRTIINTIGQQGGGWVGASLSENGPLGNTTSALIVQSRNTDGTGDVVENDQRTSSVEGEQSNVVLPFTVENVSADGSVDSLTITVPQTGTGEGATIASVNDVTLETSAGETLSANNVQVSGNSVSFNYNPTMGSGNVAVDVVANVSVNTEVDGAPLTAPITASSNAGPATQVARHTATFRTLSGANRALVRAKVLDVNGDPVPTSETNITVDIFAVDTPNNRTIAENLTIKANGQVQAVDAEPDEDYRAKLNDSSVVGNATEFAFSSNVVTAETGQTKEIDVTLLQLRLAEEIAVDSPSPVFADGDDTGTFTVTVRDQDGNPLPGSQIDVSVVDGSDVTLNRSAGETGANGQFEVTVSSDRVQTATLEFTADNRLTATGQVTFFLAGEGTVEGQVFDIGTTEGLDNATVYAVQQSRFSTNTRTFTTSANDPTFFRVLRDGDLVDNDNYRVTISNSGDRLGLVEELNTTSSVGSGFAVEDGTEDGNVTVSVTPLLPGNYTVQRSAAQANNSRVDEFPSDVTTNFTGVQFYDEANGTAPQANLTAAGVDATFAASDVQAVDETDEDGDYLLKNLYTDFQAGIDYVLVAEKPGFSRDYADVRVTEDGVAPEDQRDTVFTLEQEPVDLAFRFNVTVANADGAQVDRTDMPIGTTRAGEITVDVKEQGAPDTTYEPIQTSDLVDDAQFNISLTENAAGRLIVDGERGDRIEVTADSSPVEYEFDSSRNILSTNITATTRQGSFETSDARVSLFGVGEITGDIVNETDTEIPGAEVSLFRISELGNASNRTERVLYKPSADYQNPRTSGPTGSFAFTNVRTNTLYRVVANVTQDGESLTGFTTVNKTEAGTSNADVVVVGAEPEAGAVLDVSNLTVTDEAGTETDSVPAGETVTVSSTITNVGPEASAAGADVEFRLDSDGDGNLEAGELVATETIGSLAPNETADVEFTLDTTGVAPGNYTHGVVTADDEETAVLEVTGADEGAPFFDVESVDAPENVTAGENLTVTGTVNNTGDAAGTQNLRMEINGTNVSTGSGAVDIVFVLDDSASMGSQVDAMKRSIIEFTDEVEAGGTDARYAVVTFKDDNEVDLDYTSDVGTLQSTVDALTVSGGGDGPEDSFGAIDTALGLDTRADAETVVVHVTDAPSHYEGDGSDFTDVTRSDVAASLNEEGRTYIAVSPSTFFFGDEEGNVTALALEDVDGGVWFDIDEGDFGDLLTDEIATTVRDRASAGTSLTLDAGESGNYSITVSTEGVAPGTYDVTVSSDNDSMSTSTTIEEDGTTPPDGPTDVDGDGLFEDVNGDGTFDIFDVQAFLEGFEGEFSDDRFDFDGSGSVDIFDVQALLDEL